MARVVVKGAPEAIGELTGEVIVASEGDDDTEVETEMAQKCLKLLSYAYKDVEMSEI